jgi:hypothetical protein
MASQLPRLRDLTFDGGVPRSRVYDLPYQHGVIMKDIAPKVPEIYLVQLTAGICWRRTDRWHPISPLEGREVVWESLVHCNLDCFVDFGGFLASLVRPEELSDSRRSLLFPH